MILGRISSIPCILFLRVLICKERTERDPKHPAYLFDGVDLELAASALSHVDSGHGYTADLLEAIHGQFLCIGQLMHPCNGIH